MLWMDRHAHEQGRQQGENVRLQEGDEHFQQVDEQGEADGHGGDQEALENEDHADEGENDDVARRHVGIEADAEGKRLGELAEDLDRDHDGKEPHGQAVRHQVLQVVLEAVLLDTAPLDHGQRDERQRRGDGDVAGGGGAVGNEAQQIAEQDEEEGRQQERQVAPAGLAGVRQDDLIPQVNNKGLQHVGNPARHRSLAAEREPEDGNQQDRRNPHHDEMLW